MRVIFWAASSLFVYNYIVFPILLATISLLRPKLVYKRDFEPTISMVIAAYNEEKVIADKLLNALASDYPKDKLEIIVVSDGSNDQTPHITDSFAGDGIISLYTPERQGKVAAVNRGVAAARGEIVVLSDANCMYSKDALRVLSRNFADPGVGGVSGRKSIIVDGQRAASEGDSTYWKYESFIKSCQSKIGSISGGDGEIFAFRRALFEAIPRHIINDDASITFDIVKKGYRLVYEPDAVSAEYASIDLKDDFSVKVRMIAGGYQSVKEYFHQLLPPRTFFSFQFLSHKFFRWMAPVFLLAVLASNLTILDGPYLVFLLFQLAFYGLAALGWVAYLQGRDPGLLYFPCYFCVMNTAALVGLIRFISGQADVTKIWKKAKR